LPAPLSNSLAALQQLIDALPDYPSQVSEAKALWKIKAENVFVPIKDRLASMCSGNRRCVYCEDSWADEIEHMRPKDIYPDQTFDWGNYVLACGPCNGPKNNRFAVVDPLGALLHVTRPRNAAVLPPTQGQYALIDPRLENPLEFLWLDFDTGRYVPNVDDKSSILWLRADYTIKVLRLNERDDLVRGRRSAFRGFEGRLRTWVEKVGTMSPDEKEAFVEEFRAERYRGVWERMKRYKDDVVRLRDVAGLIRGAPEALGW
jgi:uncharacterized protein (TIGR02646 family)